MKKTLFTLIISSVVFFLIIGFNVNDNKPLKTFGNQSSVAPGNKLDLTKLNFSNRTFNTHGSFVMSNDNSASYLEEGFESTTFPPTGWTAVDLGGASVWERSTFLPKTGVGCAFVDYDAAFGEDWLLTPQFPVSAGDSLVFWLCLPTFIQFPPDSLCIRVSTTTQLPANITTYPTRILFIEDGNGYPTSTGIYQRYSAPLNSFAGQNIYIAFRHEDANGDGINIDDVAIGTPPPDDVGTFSIDVSNPTPSGNQTPKATVRNFGSAPQTFPVTMTISGGYTNQQTVTNLPPGANQQVSFANWNPSPGSYQITVYTQLGPDVNRNNDTLRKSVNVIGGAANCGWTLRTTSPTPRPTPASAFWRSGIAPNDTGFVYVIGGADPTFFNPTTENTRFNTRTNIWENKAPISLGRFHAQAVTAKNKIYVMGGYNPNFTAVPNNDIYDPATDTWSSGTGIPTPVGDFAIGVYNDTLIYLIAGYSNGDVNNVQIYSVNSNTWSAGTPKPGEACSGIRGSIFGNKIVVAGGYSQNQGGNFDSAYVGTINSSNPTQISWSGNIKYPGGNMSRLGAGTPFQSNPNSPYVIFTGGDSTGTGSTASRGTWGYNLVSNQWALFPNKPTPSNNINNLVGIRKNDTLYMVNVGGWNGAAGSTENEWLCLGSALVEVTQNGTEVPNVYSLSQNYPNPFNPTSNIKFALPSSGNVEIKIYDLLGHEVGILVNEFKQAGNYSVVFDGSSYASGVYFYRIQSGNFVESKRMVLLK